ncbi:MAG: Nif11-like leader peptide family natural product precursor [Gammaproteobacteria bacterium]|nr:Nif11-like leader peptide family natural product precursor [Gammaproteobacteria bacterium]
MSLSNIKSFSEKAKSDQALADQLMACEKVRDMISLAKENGFDFDEDTLYPPNEPQFTADQLSAKLGKALLRA